MTDDCLTTACQSRTTPRRAADGTRICPPCTTRFREHLTAIPDLWAPLDTRSALQPARTGIGSIGAAPGPSEPVNLTVLALHDTRTEWGQPGDLLNPQRALAHIVVWMMRDGAGKTVRVDAYTVAEACQVIGRTRLATWALAQDDAGRMVDQVALVHRQLAAMHGQHGRRPVGHCDPDDGCGAPIWATPAGAQCQCTTYSGQQLLDLWKAAS